MATRDTLAPEESKCATGADYAALALRALEEPADAAYAKELKPHDLPYLQWDEYVLGTNMQLMVKDQLTTGINIITVTSDVVRAEPGSSVSSNTGITDIQLREIRDAAGVNDVMLEIEIKSYCTDHAEIEEKVYGYLDEPLAEVTRKFTKRYL